MGFYQSILIASLWIIKVSCLEQITIPAHLQDCYRQPSPSLLPMTINTLIEIIRKMNFNSYTPLSVDQQAADVLNWFSIDGLERDPNVFQYQLNVIPYRRIGFQAHRQDLLFEKLILVRRRSFDADSLTLSEKCTLHYMMSASVDPWERGDETSICPNSYQDFRSTTNFQNRARLSSCPVELGAVMTPAGTVNMGRVLAGLIASLAPQQVPLTQLMTPQQIATSHVYNTATDSVSNIWVATIAGDLAEVTVLQPLQNDMDDSVIGISEEWNDTYIPTRLYFNNVPYNIIQKRSWQITDAEILGGIDGLLLGEAVKKWKQQMPEIRLSQVLEMYYLDARSNDGIDSVRKRETNFNNYIRNYKQILTEQTKNFATLLTTRATTSYFTDASIIAHRSTKIVEKFLRYYPELFTTGKCPRQEPIFPKLNLVMILDATWPPYTALQFLVSLMEEVDISYYGGSIAVINGDSSGIRVNTTSSPTLLFEQMNSTQRYDQQRDFMYTGRERGGDGVTKFGRGRGIDGDTMFGRSRGGEGEVMFNSRIRGDPNGLVLRKSFVALKNIIDNANANEQYSEYPKMAKQDVAVVVGYASTLSDRDMEIAKELVRVIKSQNPTLRFVYLTSHMNAPRFVQLTAQARSNLDTIVTTSDAKLELVLPKLQNALLSARALKPPYCRNDYHRWPESSYSEYISPGQTISYWIHPDYLCGSLEIAKTMFRNYEYGELYVCMSRNKEEQGDCKEVGTSQDVTHALVRPCERQGASIYDWDPGCRPIYFTVTGRRSRNRCVEYECRYQDQIKFSIIVQDLQCIIPNSIVCSMASRNSCFISILLLALSVITVNNR